MTKIWRSEKGKWFLVCLVPDLTVYSYCKTAYSWEDILSIRQRFLKTLFSCLLALTVHLDRRRYVSVTNGTNLELS